jgi:hypothetical protein
MGCIAVRAVFNVSTPQRSRDHRVSDDGARPEPPILDPANDPSADNSLIAVVSDVVSDDQIIAQCCSVQTVESTF